MIYFFNRNRRYNSKVIATIATTVTTAAPTILTLAIIFALTTTSTAAATTTNTSNNTSSSVIELSPQPIYQGYSRTVSQTPINETHISATDSGNGTLILPDTGETVNVTTNGTGLFSLTTGAGQGEVTIKTEEDGSGGTEESATSKFYEIVRANFATGEGKGLMIAITHTNSTGILAPLNGTIATGIVQFQPNGQSNVTLWGWQSGIPLPTVNSTTTTMNGSPPRTLMNTTTTTMMSNATAASDTNATGAPPSPEEQGEGQQQEEASSTLAPNPLFE